MTEPTEDEILVKPSGSLVTMAGTGSGALIMAIPNRMVGIASSTSL
jgi:hypothetical protein